MNCVIESLRIREKNFNLYSDILHKEMMHQSTPECYPASIFFDIQIVNRRMAMKKLMLVLLPILLLSVAFLFGSQGVVLAQDPQPELSGIEALGKVMFFDPNLSKNGDQSCAACHAAEVGYTGPDGLVNTGGAVYQGTLPNHFGNRKPPASAYAGDSPVLFFDQAEGAWFGGMFWDGRATGAALGDPLAEQAQGPFLNPLEQALANAQVLCVRVKQSAYASLFKEVWGADSLDCASDVDGVYEIGRSVAYERSASQSI
jgi:cytochrome c peroxidase